MILRWLLIAILIIVPTVALSGAAKPAMCAQAVCEGLCDGNNPCKSPCTCNYPKGATVGYCWLGKVE